MTRVIVFILVHLLFRECLTGRSCNYVPRITVDGKCPPNSREMTVAAGLHTIRCSMPAGAAVNVTCEYEIQGLVLPVTNETVLTDYPINLIMSDHLSCMCRVNGEIVHNNVVYFKSMTPCKSEPAIRVNGQEVINGDAVYVDAETAEIECFVKHCESLLDRLHLGCNRDWEPSDALTRTVKVTENSRTCECKAEQYSVNEPHEETFKVFIVEKSTACKFRSWKSFNGGTKFLTVIESRMGWLKAKSKCQGLNGHLIEFEEIFTNVSGIVSGYFTRTFWIGDTAIWKGFFGDEVLYLKFFTEPTSCPILNPASNTKDPSVFTPCIQKHAAICVSEDPCIDRPALSVNDGRVHVNTTITMTEQDPVKIQCVKMGDGLIVRWLFLRCEPGIERRSDLVAPGGVLKATLHDGAHNKKCFCTSYDVNMTLIDEAFITFRILWTPKVVSDAPSVIFAKPDKDVKLEMNVTSRPPPTQFRLFIYEQTVDENDYKTTSNPVPGHENTFLVELEFSKRIAAMGRIYTFNIQNGNGHDFEYTFTLAALQSERQTASSESVAWHYLSVCSFFATALVLTIIVVYRKYYHQSSRSSSISYDGNASETTLWTVVTSDYNNITRYPSSGRSHDSKNDFFYLKEKQREKTTYRHTCRE